MKVTVVSLAALAISLIGPVDPGQQSEKEDKQELVLKVSSTDLPDYWLRKRQSVKFPADRQTAEAINSGISGYVIIDITINAKGRIRSFQILESVPLGKFDKAAKDLMKQRRFKPGPLNKERIPVRSTLCVGFGAKDAALRCSRALDTRENESAPKPETPQNQSLETNPLWLAGERARERGGLEDKGKPSRDGLPRHGHPQLSLRSAALRVLALATQSQRKTTIDVSVTVN